MQSNKRFSQVNFLMILLADQGIKLTTAVYNCIQKVGDNEGYIYVIQCKDEISILFILKENGESTVSFE